MPFEGFTSFLFSGKAKLVHQKSESTDLGSGMRGGPSLNLKMWLYELLPLLMRFTWKVLILSLALVQLVYRVNSQMDLRN